MKITIEIPKEFEEHYNEDNFADSLKRIEVDIKLQEGGLSGLYELELIEMLRNAFSGRMKKYIVFASTFYSLKVTCEEYQIPINEVIWYKGGKLPDTIRGRYKQIKNGEIKCIGVSKDYILQMYERGIFQ